MVKPLSILSEAKLQKVKSEKRKRKEKVITGLHMLIKTNTKNGRKQMHIIHRLAILRKYMNSKHFENIFNISSNQRK
jgi:hypothetical protein